MRQIGWIRKPKARTTAVFVHGFLSSAEKCWQHENGSYWPELLKNEPELESLGIYIFSYQTGTFSGSYRLGNIVDELKENMWLDDVLKSKQLIFVCHSMGGIVVRKFLVERATELIEREKEIGLFLVASPSLGTDYANWLSPLARFFRHSQANTLRFVRDNPWLQDLDKEFINLKETSKLKIKGKELVEDKFIIFKKLLWPKQLVEPFSGAKYFSNSFRVPKSDHFSIAKPKDSSAIQHRQLCDFIKKIIFEPPTQPSFQEAGSGSASWKESQSPAYEGLLKSQEISQKNFFALDDMWVGRNSLVQELSNLIRNKCRLLILVGITGIGKTALGERLAVEVTDWFKNDWSHFHQENFDDEQQATDFSSVAARWLNKWGESINSEDRKDPQRLLSQLIKHLCKNRYLVQIDSLENIMQGDEKKGWNDFKDNWWNKFFDSYLKADTCQSCILLTSQDLPGQIESIGTRSLNFWHYQALSGLEEAEQLALFEKVGLNVSSIEAGSNYLKRIGRAYEGHPLALKIIAGEIKNKPFNGNVIVYWNKYGHEVEEVERVTIEAQEGKTASADDQWRLDRYTKTLRRNVRKRLEKTFARLKEDAKYAYILLCETSVYRCAVPEDFWLSHMDDYDCNADKQTAALEILRERYLVEEVLENNQLLLRQHNLIRSVALEFLKQWDAENGPLA